MLPNFLNRDSLGGIGLKHAADQVFAQPAQPFRFVVFSPFGLSEQSGHVAFLVVKWKAATETGIQDDTGTPNVDFMPLIPTSATDQLRGCIMGAPARSSQPVAWTLLDGSHAKIGDLDKAVARNENILGLQIAVANVEGMAIVESADDLSKEPNRFFLVEVLVGIDVLEKVALVHILQHEIASRRVRILAPRRIPGENNLHFRSVLPDIIDFHDVGVLDQLQKGDLPLDRQRDAVAVGELGLLAIPLVDVLKAPCLRHLNSMLGEDLDSNIFSRDPVSSKSDPASGPLAQGPAELPRTYMGFASATRSAARC